MKTNLNVDDYKKYKTWSEFFPNKKVKLNKIPYDVSWKPMMKKLFADPRCKNIEEKLSEELEANENVCMYPPPELLFNSFMLTSFDKVSVVIFGQDPYFSPNQAMGLAFSVPCDQDIPSSLDNVFKNQIKFNRIQKKQPHGNLEYWASQGCLLLNSSLTVKDGPKYKNCHQNDWKWFTNAIVQYISDEKDHVVFSLWGKDACNKMSLIDLEKHQTTRSSHPSGLSCAKPMGVEPAFNNCDHFGKINEYLKNKSKPEIIWQL